MGGIISHALGLRFLSPTVNLYFKDEDFFKFLSDIKYYAEAEPEEIFEDGISFPIGLIKKGREEVRLYFMHYHSFSEAKEKWLERGKRINYDNISVIVEIPYVPSEEIIEKFEKLPYKKVMLTDKKMLSRGENYQTLKSYKNQYPGKTFKYVHRFGVKRNFDEFDYVAFLNKRPN